MHICKVFAFASGGHSDLRIVRADSVQQRAAGGIRGNNGCTGVTAPMNSEAVIQSQSGGLPQNPVAGSTPGSQQRLDMFCIEETRVCSC
ncbi:hypothetical protein LBMAG46_37300 [Planctomycetia bacterium]|nr:hypothetical protein LBMAG46_37300 [Planctomycetia bacterium]